MRTIATRACRRPRVPLALHARVLRALAVAASQVLEAVTGRTGRTIAQLSTGPVHVTDRSRGARQAERRRLGIEIEQRPHGLFELAYVFAIGRVYEQHGTRQPPVLHFHDFGGVTGDCPNEREEVMARLGGFHRNTVLSMLLQQRQSRGDR
ncbi:MAG: hypothetical protein ACK55I_00170 [bacterium]